MNLTFLVKYFMTTLWQFFVISFNGFYPAPNKTIILNNFLNLTDVSFGLNGHIRFIAPLGGPMRTASSQIGGDAEN